MGGQFSLIDVPKLLHPHLSAGSVSEQHAIETWQIVRDEPIIPQNLPIDLLRISPEPSQLILKTNPIILDNNFTLSLAEKFYLWVVHTMNR